MVSETVALAGFIITGRRRKREFVACETGDHLTARDCGLSHAPAAVTMAFFTDNTAWPSSAFHSRRAVRSATPLPHGRRILFHP